MDCHLVLTLYYNIQVSSRVMMFFINSGSSSLSRKSEQIYRWMSFWSGFKVFGTNFTQTLFMFNFSGKIFLTVSLLAFTVLAFIRMLTQWSLPTISLILVTVWGVRTGWPGRWSSSVLSQLSENCFYTIWKCEHRIENSHHRPLSTTNSTQSELFLIEWVVSHWSIACVFHLIFFLRNIC